MALRTDAIFLELSCPSNCALFAGRHRVAKSYAEDYSRSGGDIRLERVYEAYSAESATAHLSRWGSSRTESAQTVFQTGLVSYQ